MPKKEKKKNNLKFTVHFMKEMIFIQFFCAKRSFNYIHTPELGLCQRHNIFEIRI